jgi:parallel beta-helix repeat protein
MKHTILFFFLCCTALAQELENVELPAELLSLEGEDTHEIPATRNCINAIAQITNSQLPFTITQSGLYCVNEDLSPAVNISAQPIITIAAPNVILNLNKKSLIAGPNTTIGILVNNQSNVTIYNGYLFNFSRAGITINPRADVRSVTTTIDDVAFFNCGVGVTVNTVRDLYIANCVCYLCNVGFFLGQNNNTLIKNCAAVSQLTIRNVIGFSLQNNVNLFCVNCFAFGNSASGFVCNGFGPAEFDNCTAQGNSFGFNCSTTAARINNNGGYVFTQCLAQTNQNDGFFLSGRGHTIQNCNSINNRGDGYQITGNGHIILDNTAQLNSQTGILLTADSSQCQVRDNTITANTNGLVNNGTNNRIYANYANDNTTAQYTGVPNVAISPTALTPINFTANIAN